MSLARLLLTSLALIFCIAPQAQAARSYDNCTGFIDSLPAVVSTQGTWCLRHDLSTPIVSGSAIEVGTDNVTIDCNEFAVTGLAAGAGTATTGIRAANRNNTTVRECDVKGFFRGIELWGSNHTVEDNKLDGNTYAGMHVEGNGTVIRRNHVLNTGGSTLTNAATGILALYSADVIENTVSRVFAVAEGFATGIHIQDNVNGNISDNRVSGLASSPSGVVLGIYMTTGDPYFARRTIRGNDVVGNGAANSQGITCGTGLATDIAITMRNVVSHFGNPLIGCSGNIENVINP